jgi:putative Mn2+ efflux pump MntP
VLVSLTDEGASASYRSGVLVLVLVLVLALVALSVGLDNFGAATAIGVSGVDGQLRLRIAVIFGMFETAMPGLGLLLGHAVAHRLGDNAKLVTGVVLCLVGGYVVVGELVSSRKEKEPAPPSTKRLLLIGAVLSIDNVAIGFALGAYHVNILAAALFIGLVSVALTLLGLELGSRLSTRLGPLGELIGGLVLLGVGLAVATGLI